MWDLYSTPWSLQLLDLYFQGQFKTPCHIISSMSFIYNVFNLNEPRAKLQILPTFNYCYSLHFYNFNPKQFHLHLPVTNWEWSWIRTHADMSVFTPTFIFNKPFTGGRVTPSAPWHHWEPTNPGGKLGKQTPDSTNAQIWWHHLWMLQDYIDSSGTIHQKKMRSFITKFSSLPWSSRMGSEF